MGENGYQGVSRGIRLGLVAAIATFCLIGLPAIGIAAVLDSGVCEGVPPPCHSPPMLMIAVFVIVIAICAIVFSATKKLVDRQRRD